MRETEMLIALGFKSRETADGLAAPALCRPATGQAFDRDAGGYVTVRDAAKQAVPASRIRRQI